MAEVQEREAAGDDSRAQLVERILNLEFPDKQMYDTMRLMARTPEAYAGFKFTENGRTAQIASRRAHLLGHALPVLQRHHADLVEKMAAADLAAARAREQRKLAEAEAKEQKRFYNRPEALANFKVWAAMDSWTLDEAVAVLLGRDPRVVTPKAVRNEIESTKMFLGPPMSQFLKDYEDLRAIAQRADVMQSATVRPVDVVRWAVSRRVLHVPKGLVEALDSVGADAVKELPRPAAQPPQPLPTAQAVSAPDTGNVKRAALVKAHQKNWPTIEADLGHANENGLSKEAKAAAHGMWKEAAALAWAKRNGKLTSASNTVSDPLHSLGRRVHRLRDEDS